MIRLLDVAFTAAAVHHVYGPCPRCRAWQIDYPTARPVADEAAHVVEAVRDAILEHASDCYPPEVPYSYRDGFGWQTTMPPCDCCDTGTPRVLDPAMYLHTLVDNRWRFERNLPAPGAPLCGSEPPAQVLAAANCCLAPREGHDPDRDGYHSSHRRRPIRGITRCHLTPGHAGIARTAVHVGLRVVVAGDVCLEPYQWLTSRRLGHLYAQ